MRHTTPGPFQKKQSAFFRLSSSWNLCPPKKLCRPGNVWKSEVAKSGEFTLTSLLVLGHRCWCCCRHYFSCHLVILDTLVRNFACALWTPSVTRARSFNTTVLPHVENCWATQNFWSTSSYIEFPPKCITVGKNKAKVVVIHFAESGFSFNFFI